MNILLPTMHVRPSAQAVPLAAGCLAAALPPGLQGAARLVDLFPGRREEDLPAALLFPPPDLIAFPLYSWNREAVLALARRLRRAAPQAKIVAGGPEAAADPLNVLLEGELDGVIRGEGEETFAELAGLLAAKKDPAGLPGLTWRGDGGPVAGPDRTPAADLDDLPSPWLAGVLSPPADGGVLWEIARGCPFGCDFCFDAKGSRGVRHFSLARLEKELELFVESRVGQVWVLDSTFNFPPERGKALLRLLRKKAPHIHFHLEAKADFLDRETIQLLSGLTCSVQLGLQSARPEVLRRIHRPLDLTDFTTGSELLTAAGVTFGLDLIYGLPEDDHRGFCESLDFALSLYPNHVDIFPLAVLPGTVLYRHRAQLGLTAQEHPPYELIESGSYSAEGLEKSRMLAAAAQIFYNHGRAVGFFSTLLRASGLRPVSFLERFMAWCLEKKGLAPQRLAVPEEWGATQVLPLQEGFTADLLAGLGREALVPAALDLIRYHYHHAETLLGEEIVPGDAETHRTDPWETAWRIAPGLRLVSFTYEILDLLEMGEVDLETFADLFRPVGSIALFFRRGGQAFCESLEEEFLRLLQGCDGRRSPREIFAGSLVRQEGEEIVAFSVAEGLLVPAGPPIIEAEGP